MDNIESHAMDDFGDAVQVSSPKGLIDYALTTIGGATTIASLSTFLVALFTLALITRFLTSRSTTTIWKGSVNAVPTLPYSLPFFRHAFFLLFSSSFLQSARDASHYGIFAVQAGPFAANIVTDPKLVTTILRQREGSIKFWPLEWKIMRNLFGVDSGKKIAAQWKAAWAPLHGAIVNQMMREPQLGEMVDRVIGKMERAIPSMITFLDNPIDQQPWEKAAAVTVFPSKNGEVYLNLMEMMRHLLGEVSIPALMGDRFMEKYPNTLNDLFTMDDAFFYMLVGVTRFFPLPSVFRSYFARKKLLDSLADFDAALDQTLEGKNPGCDDMEWDWGDMDDVSDLIVQRSKIYKEHGFKIKDHRDLPILWAFTVNSTLLVYWHILYILSTPDLLPQILSEITPYAKITNPATINGFSTAPSLKLDVEGLSKSCPLFKSTYFETMRLVNQATSIRIVANDITISPTPKTSTENTTENSDHNPESETTTTSPPTSFTLPSSTYVIMPSSLHSHDPSYFPQPTKFIPNRFIIPSTATTPAKADPLTTRPYGGGPTSCKGRLLAEKECLALVAGVLMMWEIEPADRGKGWVIPGLRRKSAIAEPRGETRVSIRRRVWE